MADSFFAVLDDLLGPDRSADGAPSVTDFLVLELPPIVERFATDFDGLPEVIEGFAGARLLIASGILVRGMVVYGLLVDDNTVELVDLDLDTSTGVRVGVRVCVGDGVDGEEPSAARFAIGHEVFQEHSVVAAVEAIPQPTMLDQASDECLGDAEHHGLLGGRCHLVRALAVHGDESRHRQAHGRTENQGPAPSVRSGRSRSSSGSTLSPMMTT